MMVVVAQATKVIHRNHLEVRAPQRSRVFLSNGLQYPRTCFLLNAHGKCKFSALLSFLRRDFIAGELPVRFALLVCADVCGGP
jgi:hypothetical protein